MGPLFYSLCFKVTHRVILLLSMVEKKMGHLEYRVALSLDGSPCLAIWEVQD